MPVAALGLKKYRFGTLRIRTADKEHSLASLGDVEISAVQRPPADHRPALRKRGKDRSEVVSVPHRAQPWNVFEEYPRIRPFVREPADFPEERGAVVAEPESLAGDAGPLAGEAADEGMGTRSPMASNVVCALNAGEASPEDALAERVDFDLADASEAGSLKGEIESADSGEGRDERRRVTHATARRISTLCW